jgi:hypothetical protein
MAVGHALDRAALAAVAVNAALLAWGLVDESHEGLIEAADELVLLFFAGELGVRCWAAGRYFWRDRWLMFDAVVVAVALLPMNINLLTLRVVRVARLTHFSRHVSHLRQSCWSKRYGR